MLLCDDGSVRITLDEDVGILMSDEVGRIWEETVGVLSRNLPWRTDEDHEKSESVWTVCLLRFEPWISWIRIYSASNRRTCSITTNSSSECQEIYGFCGVLTLRCHVLKSLPLYMSSPTSKYLRVICFNIILWHPSRSPMWFSLFRICGWNLGNFLFL
jgi:hypothetical protein